MSNLFGISSAQDLDTSFRTNRTKIWPFFYLHLVFALAFKYKQIHVIHEHSERSGRYKEQQERSDDDDDDDVDDNDGE